MDIVLNVSALLFLFCLEKLKCLLCLCICVYRHIYKTGNTFHALEMC